MADLDDLFGSDEDDEDFQPDEEKGVEIEDAADEGITDDEAEDAAAVAAARNRSPSPSPPPAKAAAPAKPMDARARLMALAAAKKQEAEATDKKKKGKKRKQAVDFGDSDEEEAGGGEAAPGSRKRQPKPRSESPPRGPAVEYDDNDEALNTATDADKAFIEDDIGEGDVDFGDDEEERLANAEEAEEEAEDELEALFSKKKRRGSGMNEAEAKAQVNALLAEMEVAAEEDHAAFDEGRPAVHKLKMLQKVVDALSTKRLHGELLDSGLLGVLKAWIEPMHDGTLPNAKVRETVLRLLHQLPVDCSLEDRKEQLKRSGLGRIVMFLFKVPDETPANRRLAKELVERWSRPILAPNRQRDLAEGEAERILAARQARQQRQAAQQAAARGSQPEEAEEEGQQRRGPRMGEAGFRYHAAIPQAAALDYVKAPTSQFGMPDSGKGGAKDKAAEHKLSKKLKTMSKGGRAGRAAIASVEGRNVTIQH
ncbi:transcription elongation factor (TFIIS) family [Micractinium conductrix]|uniref:Transcription elongation factor (TFIIS) family n=1 Tax=Micractinium conductrix TaxID=554055 RepID=A0A2P6VJT5_9CHLO|nr:transcription elongation factor (TFIIS) family [Micractinium conductrix]|eukprot:PSC74366.1 transcription elongation factor (TFIIS) family [Micractinium conductrix]